MGASVAATVDTALVSAAVALDWNATNGFVNPHFRTGTSTVNVRDNTFINPAVATNTTGYGAVVTSSGTATLSRQTGSGLAAPLPDAFARMTWDTISTGALTSTGVSMGSASVDQLLCTTGYTVTLSVYARSSHADRTAALVVTWHDAAGATLGTTLTGSTVAIGGSSWVRLSVTGTAPTNTVRAVVRVYSQGGTIWAVGDTLDVTGVLCEYGQTLNAYFDGSTALSQTEIDEGYTRGWSGTAHASTSYTRLPAVAVSGPISQYQNNNSSFGRVFTESEYRARAVIRNALVAGTLFGFTQTGSGTVPVTPGESWVGRFQIRQVGGSGPVTVYGRFGAYSAAGGNVNSGAVSPTMTLPNDGTWVDVVIPAIVIGATATNMRSMLYAGTSTLPAGTVLELRRFLAEKGTGTAGPYFDGTTPGYHWNGTADASTSSINTATTATIVRVNSADGTISAVRNADPATLTAGVWTGTDYEVPLDDQFVYRATSTDVPEIELLSPTYSVPSDGRSMLKHPGRPTLNTSVRIGKPPSLTRPVSQGVFEVLGRQNPVAVSMRRNAARGELQVLTFDAAERDALLLLLDDGTPLLLQTPAGYGVGNVYISVGELAEERVGVLGAELTRSWTLPFVVVDRPVGAGTAAQNLWSNALYGYASWDALNKSEGTWSGLLDGVG